MGAYEDMVDMRADLRERLIIGAITGLVGREQGAEHTAKRAIAYADAVLAELEHEMAKAKEVKDVEGTFPGR